MEINTITLNTIAWLQTGDATHPGSMVVIMTNGDTGYKYVNTYRKNTSYKDATLHFDYVITTDENGFANFVCPAGSMSVWVTF